MAELLPTLQKTSRLNPVFKLTETLIYPNLSVNKIISKPTVTVSSELEVTYLSPLLAYMAHGACYRWNPGLVWLHAISNCTVAVAYFSIPIALVHFKHHTQARLPYTDVLLWFAAFILSCGFGHLVDVWTIWHPHYWFSGLQQAITGLVSLYTAFLLWPLVPQVLNFISEKEQIAMALQESEERFRLYMDNSPVAAFLKDVDGKYIYANVLVQDLFGIGRDSKTDFDYFSDAIAQELRKNDLRVLKTGEPLVIEELVPTADGTTRDWLSYKFRFTDSKGANFLAGVALDINERKRSEAQLKDYVDKLAQSNEELERFAYVASHDLKAPLRTISTRLKFLTGALGTPNGEIQHQIKRISLAVTRLEQLLNDLLAYSRAGTQTQKLVPTDTQRVIASVLDSLESLVQERQVIIQVQPDLPTVLADAMQLGQLFQNLISNGIKFCTHQPQLTISGTCRAQECTFCVADNGIGIPEKSKRQIFEVFQRLHGQSEYEGSGIGLSIVKKVIQRHGGRIWVESELGHGSQFFFTLKEAKNAGK